MASEKCGPVATNIVFIPNADKPHNSVEILGWLVKISSHQTPSLDLTLCEISKCNLYRLSQIQILTMTYTSKKLYDRLKALIDFVTQPLYVNINFNQRFKPPDIYFWFGSVVQFCGSMEIYQTHVLLAVLAPLYLFISSHDYHYWDIWIMLNFFHGHAGERTNF